MTVGEAKAMWSKDSGSFSSADGITRKARILRGYTIESDATDVIEDVAAATGLPVLGELYPGTTQIYVTDIGVPQRIGPCFWMVVITYEGEFGPEGIGSAPETKPPVVTWRTVASEEPIDRDRFDKPFVTVNGEKVNGITETVHDFVYDIHRNYAAGAFNMPGLQAYLMSVSSDAIFTYEGTFAAGTGRLTRFQPSPKNPNKTTGAPGYYEVHAEVTFRYPYRVTPDKAWAKRWLHEGYQIKAPGRTQPIHAVHDGEKVSRPVLLKADGTEETDPANAIWSTDPGSTLANETLTPLPYSALGLFP